MFEPVNEIAIITASLVAFAVGNIWFSPLLFGKYWNDALIDSSGDSDNTAESPSMRVTVGLFLANAVILFVVAECIAIAKKYMVPLDTLGILLCLMVAAVIVHRAFCDRSTIGRVLVHVGYMFVVVVGGIFIISLWPW